MRAIAKHPGHPMADRERTGAKLYCALARHIANLVADERSGRAHAKRLRFHFSEGVCTGRTSPLMDILRR